MAKLSLCMIVKEMTPELRTELECLSSNGCIQEFVCATQDKKLVSAFEGMPDTNVYYYKWQDDFAAARNDTFDKATGDYIFWIDADDKVVNPEQLPKLVAYMEEKGVDWMELEYLYMRDEVGNVTERHWKPRITKRDTGIWKKSIHEAYEPTQAIKVERSDLVVIDHQVPDREKHTQESGERNLRILLKEFQETADKPDPRTLFYIGNTLMGLGRFDEAIPFYQDHARLCGWPEEKYYSLYYTAKCLIYLTHHNEAINVALEATKIRPDWPLAYFTIAEAYANMQQYRKVIEWTQIGLGRPKQEAHEYFMDDTEQELWPLVRVAGAYMAVHDFNQAETITKMLGRKYPTHPKVKELIKTCKSIREGEEFVEGFVTVASQIANKDRIKAAKLFDCLPVGLDEDIRIQNSRRIIVPPKHWEEKEIAIFCGRGNGEAWAQPSVYTGIGGSEAAVINVSEQLVKLGWKITVYNNCGQYRGTYNGVKYEPYYAFNDRDIFSTVISWRNPMLFHEPLNAKKKIVWLHDIAYPHQFSEQSIAHTDTFIFLSKWHRQNMPSIPDEKIFISNNGIEPKDFEGEIVKRPYSLIWPKSYDRGLLTLVRDIMPLVLKEVPEATLDVCYGWDTIDREIQAQPGIYIELEQLRAELTPLLEQPWITHHGRIGHKKVAELLKQSVCHPYSTEFGETNNIVSQMAQAAGCYVITTSQSGGTPEYLHYGEVINGKDIYTNKRTQEEFARAIVKALKHPVANVAVTVKDPMSAFSWERTAKTWQEGLL